MEETEHLKQLKKRTVLSTLSLFFQSGYSAFLGLIANLILTILLSPKIFGIYITMLSIISLFNYFSDVGLAASLIQKKEISDEDIKTTFTVQQLLVLTIVTIGSLLTPFIINFYKLPHEGIYLYWALLGSFFISSLKTIPSVFLERKVQFQKIVLVQIIENTCFYFSVTILAILGYGLQSFTYAVLFRAIIGLIAIYIISFWLPQIGISWRNLKELLSFGVPFQASSFLALFKDDLITLYLGKVLGFEALGYIGWAKKWAEAPIRIVMDNISRVLFPVMARLQHDKERVSRIIEKILNYQTTLLAPTILGLALIMNVLVVIIPKYNKWEPALVLFYLFCLSAFLSSYSTPFINLFNAQGQVKISFSFMAFWTAATWILTVFLTKIFGLYGFPLTQVILASTSIIVVGQAKKILQFNFSKSVYKPFMATVIMGFLVYFLSTSLFKSFITLFLIIVIAASTYFLILRNLFKINLISEIKSLFSYE